MIFISCLGFNENLAEGCASLKITDHTFCDRDCQYTENFVCQVSNDVMPQTRTLHSSYIAVTTTVDTILYMAEIRSTALEVIECGKFEMTKI